MGFKNTIFGVQTSTTAKKEHRKFLRKISKVQTVKTNINTILLVLSILKIKNKNYWIFMPTSCCGSILQIKILIQLSSNDQDCVIVSCSK